MPIKVGLKRIDIWNEDLEPLIQKYESEQNEKGQIVFYGPSNFTRWDGREGGHNLSDDILGASGKKCAINRGFGSSCSEHQLYYYPRLVRPLEPKVLVYAPFGNYSSFGYSVKEVWELAQRVIIYAMTDFPDIHVYLVGPHPRPVMTMERYRMKVELDALLKEFAHSHENCKYVNILGYEPYTDPEILKRIFVSDGVHFNAAGYGIYADMWREVLKDELAKY